MANQQVIDYIKQSRVVGIEDNVIRQTLLGSGFSVQDIEEAMRGLGTQGNVLENMQNKKPMFAPSPSGVAPARSSSISDRIAKISLTILVVLLAVIGGYFVLANYFPQYVEYVQPYLGPILDPVVNRINSITGNSSVSSTPTPIPSPTFMPTPPLTTPPPVIDSDSDGLSDADEVRYGTNSNNPDTDGDSYPDGEEVQNGYNPLGPGRSSQPPPM